MSTAGEFKTVRVSDITPSFFNAREQNVESLESENFLELCDSIKRNGLVEPIVVRLMSPGKYEAIAGTRRLLALKHIRALDAPVIIKQMSDNEVRIMSLVENVHRKHLTEDEKKAALEAIYLDGWDLWKPTNWNQIMPRERNTRTEEIMTYDLNTERGKLVLARQYLHRLNRERLSVIKSAENKGEKGKPQQIFPTDGFRTLRQRIGYAVGTQYNILLGLSSGSTLGYYVGELSPTLREQFDKDERIRQLDEEKRRELAKKIHLATRSNPRESKFQKADKVTKKFFKNLEEDKIRVKQTQSARQISADVEKQLRPQPQPKPVITETKPKTEPNCFRARQDVLALSYRIFKNLTGMELDDSSLTSGETQLNSTEAKRNMQEVATFYPQKGELIRLQSVLIPVNKALSMFRDYVYESIEAQKKNDELFKR